MSGVIFEIEGAIQSYAWGKVGADSVVAQLASAANEKFKIDIKKPYAELWMGTHPTAPSRLKCNNASLAEWLGQNPDSIGKKVYEKYGSDLPYLFKVLSVQTALSIQVHPNKSHAEHLYATKPEIYKDPNHKPELAIALTPFDGLCGFRPIEIIKRNLSEIPELKQLVGDANVEKLIASTNETQKETLKNCFQALMTANPKQVAVQLNTLLARINTLSTEEQCKYDARILNKIASEFPGDVGCFCLYFMNVLTLQPGEALFIPANEPHAYLSGDCIECMACSDNVIRAGLTPKLKDVETLCNMLTYNCASASSKTFSPVIEDESSSLFKTPVPDFAVVKIEIPSSKKTYSLIPRESASIIIVINGEGTIHDLPLSRGKIFFLGCKQRAQIQVTSDTLMFQAIANL